MPDHFIVIGLCERIALFHVTVVHGIPEDQVYRSYVHRIVVGVVPVHAHIALCKFRRRDHGPRHTQIVCEFIQTLHFHKRIKKLF